MLYLLIFISFLNGCQDRSKNPFFFFSQDSIAPIQLTYGKKNDVSKNPTNDIVFWGPTYKIHDNKICLKSHKDNFLSEEWGPTLQICFEHNHETEELLKVALERLNAQHTSNNRPEGSLKFEEKEAKLNFYTLSELTKKIQEIPIQKAFIGDGTLHKELSKKKDLSPFYTTTFKSGKPVETGFSAPYFSVFVYEEFVFIIFPTNNITLTSRANHYLVIQIGKIEKVISKLEEFFSNIDTVNPNFKKQCKNLDFQPSEIFLSGSFSFKKYLEFYNPILDSPLCVNNFYLFKDNELFTIQNPSGFVLPNSTKLFIEENSPLQGMEVDSEFWKYIYKTNSIGVFAELKQQTNIPLPSEYGYKWGNEGFGFSFKNDSNCNSLLQIYLGLDSLCGSPGLHLQVQKTEGICQPKDFILTEINPTGILQSGKIDNNSKYIELQYIGSSICDPSSLVLKIDGLAVPMFSSKKSLYPQEIIVIGNSETFLNVSNSITRNIDFLKSGSQIRMTNASNSFNLFSGLEENHYTITQNANGILHSLLPINGRWYHHPVYHSKHLYPEQSYFHYMSPGEIFNVNNFRLSNPSVTINEISWMGSYKGNESFSNDKFIEFKTKNLFSLEVEITTDSDKKFFSFPIDISQDFTVMGKQSLECFPNTPIVKEGNFSLNSKDTTIKAYDTFDGKLLTTIFYSPGLEHGYNSSTLKLRKSYVYTGFQNRYINGSKSLFSKFILPDCLENTFATPGENNEFESFLVLDKVEGNINHYLFIGSIKHNISGVKVTHYNYDLCYNTTFNVLIRQGILSIPIESFLQDTLIYQSIENSSDIKIYNLNGLYIQAVLPNPQNSQNEWVLLCNKENNSIDVSDYEIEDNASVDGITTYFNRKGINLPSNLQQPIFEGNHSFLSSGQCAYLIDPDASDITLKPVGNQPTLILTTTSTSTIGNGISKTDTLDLFKWINGNRVHIHSFGNKYSHLPFSITGELDEIIWLKEGKKGETASDYEVIK